MRSLLRRQRAVIVAHCFWFCQVAVFNLPNVTHQFFLSTLYIYLQDFKHSHRTSLDATSSPASVDIRYHWLSLAFVHALYYFAWLRPLQILTGRRRRRYPNPHSNLISPYTTTSLPATLRCPSVMNRQSKL